MASQRRGRRADHRPRDNEGILPILAQHVRRLESAVKRGQLTTSDYSRFQAIALLARDERARVKAATDSAAEHQREGQLKRLEGIGTILAQTAAREPSFFHLLDAKTDVSDGVRRMMREMQVAGGVAATPETQTRQAEDEEQSQRRVTPAAVKASQLANPFQRPDFTGIPELPSTRRLLGWELIEPLLNSFEHASPGSRVCMALPEPTTLHTTSSRDLMHHQAEVVAAARRGHRTFLLADEPGLGKTAQALLAADAADAFPLLVVVPNVVKTNWAREAAAWTPRRTATVIHGDGEDIDGFADIVIVNYEVLDRHVGWMGKHGFRGMVVDEAHFIKNKKSLRSRSVLELSDRIRARVARPLMMALTGTPLINDIEDFRAIWQFLGWIDEKKPMPALMSKLEEIGLTPLEHDFYPAARDKVVDLGIVRRRKVDVAADIPERRIADLPVELDEAVARSIRAAERELARRLVERYDAALATRRSGSIIDGIDAELVRRVATWEVHEDSGRDGGSGGSKDNVFSVVRRIGQAKAELAADYAAQLARSAGKVVFFAKHIDVMDAAQELFESRGIRFATIRGDQTSTVRQRNIDEFTSDPEVKVIVCSLTAAGVGVNLQVASDVVLAELSWTDAEQTQAIDRVHRIGQSMPVTAWRILAAGTIDTRIAELIDAKAGLAARALDGAGEAATDPGNVQVHAMVALLTAALEERESERAHG